MKNSYFGRRGKLVCTIRRVEIRASNTSANAEQSGAEIYKALYLMEIQSSSLLRRVPRAAARNSHSRVTFSIRAAAPEASRKFAVARNVSSAMHYRVRVPTERRTRI